MPWWVSINDIKYYTSSVKKTFVDTKYYIYLYYIRRLITRANSTQDLINILKNMASNYNSINTDELFTILTDCFIKFPLTDIELQKMSTWQQFHTEDLGMDSFTTTLFWTSTIQAIQEIESSSLNHNKTLKGPEQDTNCIKLDENIQN